MVFFTIAVCQNEIKQESYKHVLGCWGDFMTNIHHSARYDEVTLCKWVNERGPCTLSEDVLRLLSRSLFAICLSRQEQISHFRFENVFYLTI